MNRRQFLGSPAAAAFAQAPKGDHRNVLLLIADDHSPIAGCYGNPIIRTPNMDRLAREGVRFSNAFCTTPSCSASRSVVLTGLHNHTNGQFGHAHMPHNFHTHLGSPSIPGIAKANGVATGVIGKLHVLPPEVYTWDFESPGGSAGTVTRDVYGMAQKATQFFQSIGEKPFYLHVGFGDPHRAGKGFANERSYPNVKKNVYSPADVLIPPFLPDLPEVRAELAEYYQAIDRLDQGVGFLLEALEKSGRAKDTLVIYMSDHGMPFPGAKGSPYDSGLACPLILRAPQMQRRGVVNNALTHWPDIAPTVLEWMRLPAPAEKHGRSLLPILEQESPSGRDEFFFSHTFHEVNNYYPVRGIRTRTHKYVRVLYPELEMPIPSDLYNSSTWRVARNRPMMGTRKTAAVLHHAKEELYNLERDPNETTNIAESPEAANLLPRFREQVRKFRSETKDPWFIENQGLS